MKLLTLAAALLASVGLWALPVHAAEPVKITIHRNDPGFTSQITLGITHTHLSMDRTGKNAARVVPEAAQRAKDAVAAVSGIQNSHIIGWGAYDINPEPGVYKWESLDARVDYMRSMKQPMVLTLCTAPGWMKVRGDTWKMEDRPKRECFDDFAGLCVEVAKRYPDVRAYQVWNEFKGFWNNQKNNWDVEEYTEMYNKVYDALKAYDPALKVGGFYLVIQGTGSVPLGKSGVDTYNPVGSKDRYCLEYWVKNKHGADFVCLDRGVRDYHDNNKYTIEELASLLHWYQDVGKQVYDVAKLPIWWAEYYAAGGKEGGNAAVAAFEASIYANMIRGHTEVALLWNPVAGEISHGIVSNITDEDGGRPLPHYDVFKMINEHFGKGTQIIPATSTSPMIDVLATKEKAMIVNLQNQPAKVSVDGREISLKEYDVQLIDIKN